MARKKFLGGRENTKFLSYKKRGGGNPPHDYHKGGGGGLHITVKIATLNTGGARADSQV